MPSPTPAPLARLLQVSDLHFGELNAAGLPYAPPPYLYPPFTGWLGHDPSAAREVARFTRGLQREGAPLFIVTAGDLTAWGDPAQFSKAEGFLGATVLDGPSRIGLRDTTWLDRAVPGNHDHWAGAWRAGTAWPFPQMFGAPTQAFHNLFGPLPATGDPLLSVAGLPPIRFIRLDTDADVRPFSRNRLLARGAFLSHLRQLDANLPAKEPREVRVVLAHHCREYRGRTTEIDVASRSALDDFLVRHEADVLLSGHTHAVHVAHATITTPSGTRNLLYARCGTSTQVNPRDMRLRRLAGWAPLDAHPRSVERSVVLHELGVVDGRVVWATEAYVLSRRNRFEHDQTRPNSRLSKVL